MPTPQEHPLPAAAVSPILSKRHEIILKRIRDIPSLPEVVNRIIQLLATPGTPASEIATLVSYDPGLTSKVLRMVNSAAYGVQRQVSSIQHGIMILGFNTVRGLVLSASIFKLFEKQKGKAIGLDHQAFWEHSILTSVAARVAANRLRIPESDDAFSAGMLHDIGKMVMDVHFHGDYANVMREAKKRRLPWHGEAFLRLEESVTGTTHTGIGSYLAAKWRLPITITEVIQFHHAPWEAEHCQPLVYLVALANELAQVQQDHLGIYQRSYFSEPILEYFNLEDEMVQAMLAELKAEMESVGEFMDSLSQQGH